MTQVGATSLRGRGRRLRFSLGRWGSPRMAARKSAAKKAGRACDSIEDSTLPEHVGGSRSSGRVPA